MTIAPASVGIRTWIGQRVGYAFGADLSEGGLCELAAAAATTARIADEDPDAVREPRRRRGTPENQQSLI